MLNDFVPLDGELQMIFVYGSLKRGGALHSHLTEQQFLGTALTAAHYQLFALAEYPGLIEADDGVAIEGEVFEVTLPCLDLLDSVEGVAEGLYARRLIVLQSPFHSDSVQAWFYCRSIRGLRNCGNRWP